MYALICVCACMLNPFSRVWLFATTWNAAQQAPLSMGFPRQEHCSGLPFPSPQDLPDPGVKATSPALAGRFFTTETPGKPTYLCTYTLNTYSKNHFTDPCFNLIDYYSFPKILKSTLASVKVLQINLDKQKSLYNQATLNALERSWSYIICALKVKWEADNEQ